MIIVKPACEDDSKDIFTWRNDKLTREMSLTTDPVAWEGHELWFENTLKNDTRLLLMCIDTVINEKICVVRFDLNINRALVSINLAPSMRGNGLAKICLNAAINFLKTHAPSIDSLDAEIKSTNRASIATFQGVGFSQVGEDSSLLHFQCKV
jgi:RimJ/RimL family protein N-acetyltransferase